MEIAALILSVLSLLASLTCLVLMLAKNFFSTHQVQLQPIDPFDGMFPKEMGKNKFDMFQDLDAPLNEDEIDDIKGRKTFK